MAKNQMDALVQTLLTGGLLLSLGFTYRWLSKKFTNANLSKPSQILFGGIAIALLLVFIAYLFINRKSL